VTSRPTLGEFLGNAHRQLDAAGQQAAVASARDIGDITVGLSHLIAVIGSCCDDIAAALTRTHRSDPAASAWARASAEAQYAAASGLAALGQQEPRVPAAGDTGESGLARHLDAAASSLAAGRDLLHTHLASGPDGGVLYRSAWAPVITSGPAARSLLAEITSIGEQAAALCAGAAPLLSPAGADESHRLATACQWLQIAGGSARAAQRHCPVPAADRELVHAIPARVLPPRRLPDGTEPVPALCDGVITTAERARHAAWLAARLEPRSPAISITSWRKIATASTVTSHHCHILLEALAARASQHDQHQASAALARAAADAATARGSWLQAADAFAPVTTDVRWHISPAAADARDLALWTGRLTYAYPGWTLAHGPAHQTRTPEGLAPTQADARLVLAAIHHASEALSGLATANMQQARSAARARRILMPTPSLYDQSEAVDRFICAPKAQLTPVLNACQNTTSTSAQAAGTIAGIAIAIKAPSRTLAAAKAAAEVRAGASHTDAEYTPRQAEADLIPDLAGPIESRLRGLGVTSRSQLRRASSIDRLGHQLTMDAAAEILHQSTVPAASRLAASADSAPPASHRPAITDGRAVDPRRVAPRSAEPQAEP
jgi:hypothetical protein